MKSTKSLKSVNLIENNITNKWVKKLAMNISPDSTIEKLELKDNLEITDASIPDIVKIIKSSSISEMDIPDINLNKKKMISMLLIENVFKSNQRSLKATNS